jgi:DEAD/DEAH box helicase/Helicase conserved C-terminal domain
MQEPRLYQIEIYERALQGNTIAVLPTGAGKTLIAVMLMRERLVEMRACGQSNNENIIFIAPTKVLVGQQQRYIERNMSDMDAIVRGFTGDNFTTKFGGARGGDFKAAEWQRQLSEIDVMVLTPELMRQVVERNWLDMNRLNLLVMDECHHCTGKSPLAIVCRLIQQWEGEKRQDAGPKDDEKKEDFPLLSSDAAEVSLNVQRVAVKKPLIFGLTASPSTSKKSAEKNCLELEQSTNCKIITVEKYAQELQKALTKTTLSLLRYETDNALAINALATVALSDINSKDSALLSLFTKLAKRSKDANSNSADQGIGSYHFCVSTHGPLVLHQAYLRARYASHLCSFYKTLRTLHMEPRQMAQLAPLNLPDLCMDSDMSGSAFSARNADAAAVVFEPSFRANQPISSPVFNNLFDVQQSIGQVIRSAEEGGSLCALYALQMAMDVKSSSMEDRLRSLVVPVPSNQPLEQSACTFSTIDVQNVHSLVEDICLGPFEPSILLDAEYCVCASLIETVMALAQVLDCDVCRRAELKMHSLLDPLMRQLSSSHAAKWYNQKLNSRLGEQALVNEGVGGTASVASCPFAMQCQGPIALLIDIMSRLTSENARSSLPVRIGTSGILHQLALATPELQAGDGMHSYQCLKIQDVKTIAFVVSTLIIESVDDEYVYGLVFGSDGVKLDGYVYESLEQAEGTFVVVPATRPVQPLSPAISSICPEHSPQVTPAPTPMITHDEHPTDVVSTDSDSSLEDWEKEDMPLPPVVFVPSEAPAPIAGKQDDVGTTGGFHSSKARSQLRLKVAETTSAASASANTGGAPSKNVPVAKSVVSVSASVEDLPSMPGPMSYQLVSSKFKALFHAVLERLNDEYSDGQMLQQGPVEAEDESEVLRLYIVFCRMKLTATALKTMFAAITRIRTKILSSLRTPGLGLSIDVSRMALDDINLVPHSLVGGDKQQEQLKVLAAFQTGTQNILFATDIAEEGLDVQPCRLVVNFDMVRPSCWFSMYCMHHFSRNITPCR